MASPLAACGGDGGALDGLSAGKQGRVSGVISGDSFEIDGGEVVHLAGIEAPRPGEPYGEEAAAALTRLVNGQTVELLHGGARTDPFQRTVAQVRTLATRRWVQGELLDAGAVRVRTFADNRALAKVMLAREARARAARRGLWNLDDYAVRLPDEVDPAARGLVIVEGRIARVGRLGDGGVYIDFSRDWRGVVSAEIPRSAMHDFRAAGIDPMDLQGRLVRIRGGVHGLRLTLDHPEQVERLRS
jgi:micrococcal nuclease